MSRVLVAAVAFIMACEAPSDPGIEVRLGISPTPPTVGDTRLVVTLGGADAQEGPLEVAVGGMLQKTEAAAAFVVAEPRPNGDYVVSGFPFDAPGEWTMTVRVTFEDRRTLVRSFPVRVVGPLRTGPRNR